MEAAIKSSIFSLAREKISVDFPETTNPPVAKKKKKLFLLGFFPLMSFVSQIPLAW